MKLITNFVEKKIDEKKNKQKRFQLLNANNTFVLLYSRRESSQFYLINHKKANSS